MNPELNWLRVTYYGVGTKTKDHYYYIKVTTLMMAAIFLYNFAIFFTKSDRI
jgi:hypothetical protein